MVYAEAWEISPPMPTTIDTLADSLRAQLDAKRADVVARPGTVTPRGAGTDKYHQ